MSCLHCTIESCAGDLHEGIELVMSEVREGGGTDMSNLDLALWPTFDNKPRFSAMIDFADAHPYLTS